VGFDPAQLVQKGKYYAIIIGVQDYDDPLFYDLGEPLKDAKAIQTILTSQYTFEPKNLKLLANPTRKQIIGQLYNLNSKLTKNDNLLVFYAGNVNWSEKMKQGYWIPSEAAHNNPSD
jgi:hypothetical protein